MSAVEPPVGSGDRIAEVIGAVARQALADWGVRQIALLDDGSPEAGLAARLLEAEIGPRNVFRVTVGEQQVELVLQAVGGDRRPDLHPGIPSDPGDSTALSEIRRLRARLMPDALLANPSNKTALLLGGPLPPEPLFPLGDLYASEVHALAGGWSAPPEVRGVATAAGGIARLDAALRALIDHRDPRGLRLLEPEARLAVEEALSRGRASRVYGQLVPKIGIRTLRVDLFE